MPDDTPLLGWDADGVVVDSRALAWRVSEQILGLFGKSASIHDPETHAAAFGATAQEALVGREHSSTLRAMHRLVMRARASEAGLFEDVVKVVPMVNRPSVLITAAFGAGIRTALASSAQFFTDVRGREHGPKDDLIATAAREGMDWYITDTVRDIARCRANGLRVIAVGWGYGAADALEAAAPDHFTPTLTDLIAVLTDLSFLE